MRLSEAIRLGAMLKPQTTRAFSDRGKTCALGAALDAIGELAYPARRFNVRRRFPIVKQRAVHPIAGTSASIEDIITSLSDWWAWTRERIADWVETIEGLPRADGDSLDIPVARSQTPPPSHGDDRGSKSSSSVLVEKP